MAMARSDLAVGSGMQIQPGVVQVLAGQGNGTFQSAGAPMAVGASANTFVRSLAVADSGWRWQARYHLAANFRNNSITVFQNTTSTRRARRQPFWPSRSVSLSCRRVAGCRFGLSPPMWTATARPTLSSPAFRPIPVSVLRSAHQHRSRQLQLCLDFVYHSGRRASRCRSSRHRRRRQNRSRNGQFLQRDAQCPSQRQHRPRQRQFRPHVDRVFPGHRSDWPWSLGISTATTNPMPPLSIITAASISCRTRSCNRVEPIRAPSSSRRALRQPSRRGAWRHSNGDGNLDLAVRSSSANVFVFNGLGNGTFSAPATYSYLSGGTSASIATADVNGDDGAPDLIISDAGGGNDPS